MSAVGIYRAVRVSWQNPADRDLDHVEVWAGTVNDRSLATLVGIPQATPSVSQTWLHTNLTPGDTLYYWAREVDHTGNLSTFFPASPTAGWPATVTGIPPEDLPLGDIVEWETVSGTTQAMVASHGYLPINGALTIFTLPVTAALFSVLAVLGLGAGKWVITQNASQSIHVGRRTTTVGVGGSLAIRHQHDNVLLRCVVADTQWEAVAFA